MAEPRKAVKEMEEYVYPQPVEGIMLRYSLPKNELLKLDYNEPTRGLDEAVAEKVAAYVRKGRMNWYPDGRCSALRKAIASKNALKEDEIMAGNGSDELIKCIALAFIDREDEVVIPYPNYSMYYIGSQLMGARIRNVPCGKSMAFSAEDLIRSFTPETKAVFISNPNTPTGFAFTRQEIATILESTDAMVAVDEAYYGFGSETAISMVERYRNLIVLRTFSKAYSMAGLRIGYCAADRSVVKLLEKVRDPESVNALAQVAALEILKRDYSGYVEETKDVREYLSRELRRIGLEVYPSQANFILVRLPFSDEFVRKLESRGILVRNRSQEGLLEGCVRIGVPERKYAGRLLREISWALGRKRGSYEN